MEMRDSLTTTKTERKLKFQGRKATNNSTEKSKKSTKVKKLRSTARRIRITGTSRKSTIKRGSRRAPPRISTEIIIII